MKVRDFFDRQAEQDEELRAEMALAATALDLARNVHRLRRSLGWSQSRLSDEAGTSQPRIAEIEAGTGNPTLRTLTKLAKALSSRVDELVAAQEVWAAEPWQQGPEDRPAERQDIDSRFAELTPDVLRLVMAIAETRPRGGFLGFCVEPLVEEPGLASRLAKPHSWRQFSRTPSRTVHAPRTAGGSSLHWVSSTGGVA